MDAELWQPAVLSLFGAAVGFVSGVLAEWRREVRQIRREWQATNRNVLFDVWMALEDCERTFGAIWTEMTDRAEHQDERVEPLSEFDPLIAAEMPYRRKLWLLSGLFDPSDQLRILARRYLDETLVATSGRPDLAAAHAGAFFDRAARAVNARSETWEELTDLIGTRLRSTSSTSTPAFPTR